jgi:hypothetical protein
MEVKLGDFNATVSSEDIFKPKIGTDSLHGISDDNGVRVVNLIVKSDMFPHRNIHIYAWTSPDEKTRNEIDHILIDRSRPLSILKSDRSGQQIVILTTIWWWQKLGRDWQ